MQSVIYTFLNLCRLRRGPQDLPVSQSLLIGSGASVGREGPIVQIGSSLGSTLGQVVGTGPAQTRILVAAGAAGAAAGAGAAIAFGSQK